MQAEISRKAIWEGRNKSMRQKNFKYIVSCDLFLVWRYTSCRMFTGLNTSQFNAEETGICFHYRCSLMTVTFLL